MNFFGYIREWFIYATQQFVNLALWAYDSTVVPDFVGDIFNYLSSFTSGVAGYLWTASSWYDEVTARVAQIVSLDNIYSSFRTYFDYAVYTYNWVLNSWVNVTGIIDNWWYAAQQTVLSLISNIETWTSAELNNVREWVLTLIADIEAITPDLLEKAKTYLLAVIDTIGAWTIAEFTNVREWVLAIWADIETWTLTQAANVQTAILSIISDLELWTTTEFNNIKELLGAILPWDDILALIISWGAIPGAAIQDLINSTLQSWFPFYDDLAELWNSIVEFFTDPWGWLYDRVEELFDRFW